MDLKCNLFAFSSLSAEYLLKIWIHRLSKRDEMWHIDRSSLAVACISYHCQDCWPLAQGIHLGRHNSQVRKKFATLFSYIVWQSAMKFGGVRGQAIRFIFSEFGELWFGGPTIPRGDMHQSFTDVLVIIFRCSGLYKENAWRSYKSLSGCYETITLADPSYFLSIFGVKNRTQPNQTQAVGWVTWVDLIHVYFWSTTE